MIDFEYSHIKLDGIDIGVSLNTLNVYNKNFWLHDIFKILMFIYSLVRVYKEEYIDIISKMLSFFIGKEMNNSIFRECTKINDYYNLQYFETNVTYEDYINFFKKTLYDWVTDDEENDEEDENESISD